MEKKNIDSSDTSFTIMIDRIEGEFAVCEFPDDEELKNVELSLFPFQVKENERYKIRYVAEGKLQYISKVIHDSENNAILSRIKKRMNSRLLRFK